MGNSISMPENLRHLVDSIKMSNGLTSVFIEVLTISGSILAKADREKEIIIWLAQQDQSVVGIGTVGFDIDDIPWTTENFEREKDFMLRAISNAIGGLGWERLSYEPRKDWVIGCLEQFKLMIDIFDKSNININSYIEWSEIEEGDNNPTIPFGYPKCQKHSIYLSCHGCILCNDESY
ncbi:hypothetical protein EJP82_18145 [Paenibacillus anaericanus]|uniref:Uncharacterized protein n=1 Tax=Paenibacillus anaericanus TaxID=170367 RepID=A0A3S1DPW8_9BACL|nr:hypothetical protein [Paenibacillus anaericanus]RUT44533.1 hypothetical protein EJP82_18145 [Paenibacillus anaericanus]